MIYRKQTGFDDFRCIADKCPKSCCEGWQIMIDSDSLKKYQNYSGTFEERLRTGIDKENSCFRQHQMRCHMLASTGLCDLQSALGESYLCDTCRQFPRHMEDFLDLREYSLSLSCPEAVRMLMDPEFIFGWTESEDEEYDDPEEFDDFDPFLFDKLTYGRDQMLRIAKDPSGPFQERMDLIITASLKLQDLYDQGEIFEMDDISYDSPAGTSELQTEGSVYSYDYMMQSLKFLQDLEVLESSWSSILASTGDFWKKHPENSEEWKQILCPDRNLLRIFENLLQSFLFTYMCGSIYDGQIYARTMIAAMNVRWILMLHIANPEIPLEKMIYLFSREIEHSDQNINALISYFEEEL
ncbi:MAG: flagellin lysine-N-methylase [Eubacteriales bacterium]|nr:flagellin lysine-N-methylase [Eubacteriales bacterium]